MLKKNSAHSSAPVWRRVAALVYDSFILLAISLAYGAFVLAVYVAIFGSPEKDYTPVLSGPLFQLGWFFSLTFFYYYFWSNQGQTIGMRAWRLKLTNDKGHTASRKDSLFRAAVSPWIVGLFFIGYIWKFIDKDKLCLHDRLSNTRVIMLPKNA